MQTLDAAALDGALHAARERSAAYILASADFSRRDRLFPCHYGVFGTNPLSVAYGASGVALFLHDVLGEVPADVRAWMTGHRVHPNDYPPGLFVGMAGIACAFWEVGLPDEAERVLAGVAASPLRFQDPTMFLGAAGWGAVCLAFHARTGRQSYLDQAAEAVDYLLRTARSEGDGLYWLRAGDPRVNYGDGYGASGIARYLVQAGLLLGRDDAVDAARRGFAYDLAHREQNAFGWTWPDKKNGMLALPYWGHGASGVGTAALRLYEALGDVTYLDAAETIAEGAFAVWSVLPSVVDGLSGIGEFMLDCHRATGRAVYLARARRIAETVLWYAVERPAGVAFPGRWFTRLSTDYATGSAGIGLFLGRVLDPSRPRTLVDLPTDRPPRAAAAGGAAAATAAAVA